MSNDRSLLEREMQNVELRPFTLETFQRRRERKQRNRRIGGGVVALIVAVIGIGALVRAFPSDLVAANDPRSQFLGEWVTAEADGSTPTMTIGALAESGEVAIEMHDDAALACSGAPSTMTGTGQLADATELVIPAPVLTCDDGSEPEARSGLPLAEQLRNLTFVRDPQTDTLTENGGAVWVRADGEAPSPEPPTSGGMWPQANRKEVRDAQELADAGDPRYTWQVDPQLRNWHSEPSLEESLGDSEIVARFLREELGWEAFSYHPIPEDGFGDGIHSNAAYIRCAPGTTSSQSPIRGCAPTIDDVRYEMVSLDLAQLVRQDNSGIWVVTGWRTLPPFVQK